MWALAAPFVPVGVTNGDKRSSFVPVARPGTKEHPLLSRTGVPGWETGTTGVSQPGQINVFVVVAAKGIGTGVGRLMGECLFSLCGGCFAGPNL